MTRSISRIEQVFDAALEVPPARRAEWLDDNCAGDDVSQRRLERLLAADETNSDGVLDEPAVSRASEEMPKRVVPPDLPHGIVQANRPSEFTMRESERVA